MSIEDKLNLLMENKDESLEDELLEAVKKKMKEEDEDKKGGDVQIDPVAAAANSDEKEEMEDEPDVTNTNPIDPEYSDEKEEEKEEEEEEKKEQEMKEGKKKTPSVKESVTELLGGEELSEDFKLKAATIFEAAVNNKFYELKESLEADYSAKEQALNEEFEAKAKTLEEQTAKQLEEAVAEIEKTLSDKIDGYFDVMSEQWISDNELALESGVKAELVESFIDGMKTLFEEHYVDVPDEKVDVIQEMENKIHSLEKSLTESVEMFRTLKDKADAVIRENIIEQSAKGMTDLDASRFKRLAEDVEFDNEKTFTKKVSIIKESFFRVKEEKAQETKKPVVNENQPLLEEKQIPTENDPMAAYIKALKGSK